MKDKSGMLYITSVIMAALLIVMTMVMGIYPLSRRSDRVADGNGDVIGGTATDGQDLPRSISFTAPALARAAAEGKTVDIKINSTVRPETAANKAVDYTLSWESGTEHTEDPVTDYVTVTQDSDGSTEATVSCLQAFGDDVILLTVTTREGGFQDHCRIRFEGRPTQVLFSGAEEENGIYRFGTEQEYRIGLTAGSPLWTSEGYDEFEIVSFGGSPEKVILQDASCGNISSDPPTWDYGFSDAVQNNRPETVKPFADLVAGGFSCGYSLPGRTTVTEAEAYPYFNCPPTSGDYSLSGGTAKIEGNELVISCNMTVKSFLESYYTRMHYESGILYHFGKFKAFKNSAARVEDLYLSIIVREKKSGVTGEMKIYVTGEVSGVQLSEHEIKI